MSKIYDCITEADTEAVSSNSLKWFAAYTTPRHEKHVSELLKNQEIENFLPLYQTTRKWQKRSQVVLELPLFPTYVFIRITHSEQGAVLGLPGVLSIVGSAREPWALPDFEIEALRSGLHLSKSEPYPYLVVGERVRIIAGPMAGMEGVLVRKKDSFRVVLTIDMIMQSVAVEVDSADLEPAAPVSTPIAHTSDAFRNGSAVSR